MSISRKKFIQKACLTGLCLCGFNSIISSESKAKNDISNSKEDNGELSQEWIANLLSQMEDKLNKNEIRKIIRMNAIPHYNNLKMDEMLSNYIGDLEGFINMISEKWGWIINYDKTRNIIIADENKNYCVCPLINQKAGLRPESICYCSEGFAEKMFSKVTGKKVKATVISSVIRKDKSCKYKIEIC